MSEINLTLEGPISHGWNSKQGYTASSIIDFGSLPSTVAEITPHCHH